LAAAGHRFAKGQSATLMSAAKQDNLVELDGCLVSAGLWWWTDMGFQPSRLYLVLFMLSVLFCA
jgi:hypothetical protein